MYDESSFESDTNAGESHSYTFSYKFTTTNGKKVNSSVFVDGEAPEKYKDTAYKFQIEVVYLKGDPEVNIPKDQMSESLTDTLITKSNIAVVFGLILVLGTGFELIKRSIKKYLAEIKTLTLQQSI